MFPIVLFEDPLSVQFSPIALLRPVFELKCGHFSSRQRFEHVTGAPLWGAVVRPYLTEAYAEEQRGTRVNAFAGPHDVPLLMINGRWLGDAATFLKAMSSGGAGYCDGELAGMVVPPGTPVANDPWELAEQLQTLAGQLPRVEVGGHWVRHPWDLVRLNREQLQLDFDSRSRYTGPPRLDDRVALLGDHTEIHIDPTAEIDPFVVLDARPGPIWIDEGVRVQAFTRIEGPCFIGAGTLLFRANIRAGCSIGPVCRVGGEVEESIFHGYGNKYHDGFVGHSYVCPWVNLGALTSNSDLKNDYSTVKVPVDGLAIETGETKVGCFIGDHTKTALCSLFNTGSAIGVMSQILPGGELLPKHIPSFSRLWHGRIEELPLGVDAHLGVAHLAMQRRQQMLTPAGEALLKAVYELTRPERDRAFSRQTPRHQPPAR